MAQGLTAKATSKRPCLRRPLVTGKKENGKTRPFTWRVSPSRGGGNRDIELRQYRNQGSSETRCDDPLPDRSQNLKVDATQHDRTARRTSVIADCATRLRLNFRLALRKFIYVHKEPVDTAFSNIRRWCKAIKPNAHHVMFGAFRTQPLTGLLEFHIFYS